MYNIHNIYHIVFMYVRSSVPVIKIIYSQIGCYNRITGYNSVQFCKQKEIQI